VERIGHGNARLRLQMSFYESTKPGLRAQPSIGKIDIPKPAMTGDICLCELIGYATHAPALKMQGSAYYSRDSMRTSVPVANTAHFTRNLIDRGRRLASLGVAAMLACTAAMQTAHADATLDHIKQSGTLNVGIIVDGGHFGSLDPATQQPLGFNVDLAADLARRLGVKLQVVSVQPSTRVQFLQQGKVDILIANMEYTPERGAAILDYVPTPYSRVGGVAIVPRDSSIHTWEDLRGKPVCLSQGSSYTRPLIEQYGAVPKGFRGASESLLATQG
jgi:hypothetical protein